MNTVLFQKDSPSVGGDGNQSLTSFSVNWTRVQLGALVTVNAKVYESHHFHAHCASLHCVLSLNLNVFFAYHFSRSFH